MKFPKIKSVTIAVTYFFAFYAICGCSSTRQTTSYLDKYDSMPYKTAITVNSSEDVAYKAAITTLQKHGYILTLSDPQTGVATLEQTTSTKLPEEDKKAQVDDSGPSAGTIILYALAIVLIVGIIVILLASSGDDSKDKKKDTPTDYKTGRTDVGHPSQQPTHKINDAPHKNEPSHREHHENDVWHDHPGFIGPFFNPWFEPAPGAPPQNPGYRYIVTVNTNPLSDSTTEVSLATTREDLMNGWVTSSRQIENKYLNYSIFDGIGEQMRGR